MSTDRNITTVSNVNATGDGFVDSLISEGWPS